MSPLEEACRLSCEAWVHSLPQDIEQHEFSAKFRRKMDRLSDKMRGDRYHTLTRKAVRALIAAAVVIFSATVVMANPQSREYIIKNYLGKATYSMAGNADAAAVTDFQLGYIPAGFTKTGEYLCSDVFTFEYENERKNLEASKFTIGTDISFSTSDSDYEEVSIGGISYVLFTTPNGENAVIFNNGQYTYLISGDLNKDELIKVAEGAE